MSSVFLCKNAEETQQLAQKIASEIPPGQVIAFFGDLAAGKTTFIRALASELACVPPELINSPTFQYLNIYSGKTKVFHFDLYRMTGPEDFLSMGFDELLHSDGVSCIEWAERIESILPETAMTIRISHVAEMQRLIEIKKWP